MIDRLLKVTFILSLILVAFGYGALMVRFKLPPYYLLRKMGRETVMAFINRESHLGLEPSRWLRPAHHPGTGVTAYDRRKMQPGLTFLTGFFDNAVAMQLIDEDGAVVHRWIDTRSWNTAEIHGAVPLPDGSVIFERPDAGLRRMDKCGNVVWTVDHSTHHSVHLSPDDNSVWVSARRVLKAGDPRLKQLPGIRPPFTEDLALQVNLDGEVLREISLAAILFENGQEAVLFANGDDAIVNRDNEITHLNDVEPLSSSMAEAFPMFTPGDLIVSLRNLNLLTVFDPKTRQVKWLRVGPWVRQHDPDFDDGGRILVFNNRKDDTPTGRILGGSTIMAVDPVTDEVTTLYRGTQEMPFFTNVLGKQQKLANGNLLISSGEEGRVFEVTPDGEVVWEFVNRYDDERVLMTHEGTRYTRDYFDVESWDCPAR